MVFTVPRDPARFPQFNLPAISPTARVVFLARATRNWCSEPCADFAIQSLGNEISGPPYPFWSPDRHFIAFFSGGKLKRIAADSVAHLRDRAAGRAEEVGIHGTSFSAPSRPYIASGAEAGDASARARCISRELRHVWPTSFGQTLPVCRASASKMFISRFNVGSRFFRM